MTSEEKQQKVYQLRSMFSRTKSCCDIATKHCQDISDLTPISWPTASANTMRNCTKWIREYADIADGIINELEQERDS